MSHNYLVKIRFLSFLYFIFCIFFSNQTFSQCAGIDNSITICNKELDVNLQKFNLFNQLNGTPQAGGTWKSNDPLNEKAINTLSGELNLWNINKFGMHLFTYTNETCNESAIITINLGGYPGEDNISGGANACSDNVAVNLYTFLDNNFPNLNADINGKWEEAPGTIKGFLNDQFFDAKAATEANGIGTYTFTYTVGEIETCVPRLATIVLEVHRSPESGVPIDITICDTEDFSSYTNINLLNQLIGGDSNGIWKDLNFTNQITDPLDSTINIKEIYENFGAGKYKYEYTVFPIHGVCRESVSIITISIPKISGKFQVENQCKDGEISIDILNTNTNQDPVTYNLEYEIINTITNNIVYTATKNSLKMINEKGLLLTTFLLPVNAITESGTYIIRSKTISNVQGLICDSLTISEDTFVLYDTQVSVPQLCFEGSEANITINNLLDTNGNASNNTYFIDYIVEDLINGTSKTIENHEISFNNGTAILPIDISTFSLNSIDYNLKIGFPTDNSLSSNIGLNCIDHNFSAKLVPDDIKLSLIVDNQCDVSSMEVAVDAPALINGEYTVIYEVTEINKSDVLIIGTNVFSNGKSTSKVDISFLKPGDYKITIKSTQNDTTPCRTVFDFELKENFSINGTPAPPTLKPNQSFCLSNHLPNGPTIADISVDSDNSLTWYEDNTSTTPLPESTLLIDGEDYFVTATGIINNCLNSIRSSVTVIILPDETPKEINLGLSIDNKCNTTNLETVIDAPILIGGAYAITYTITQTGETNILIENTIAATGGIINIPIDISTLNTGSYEIVLKSTQNDTNPCRTKFDFEFKDNFFINGAPEPPVLDSNQTFCLSNLPNAPIISDISVNTGDNLTWYIDNTSTTPLPESTLLIHETDYFVTATDNASNCQSLRAQVSVSIITTEDITSSNTNPIFCGIDQPTINDLDVNAVNGNIIWYDMNIGGSILPTTTLLENGKSYFAVQNINGCEHSNRLQFNIALNSLPLPEYTGSNLLCPLDNLSLLDLEKDIILNSNHEFIWYDAIQGGNELSNSEEIQEDIPYFVTFRDTTTNCESERLPIIFSLSECDPEKYDFFIPDGFSPNGDNVNDTYYIPNIEFFYPAYELEIFNRYGQSLFRGNINSPAWNGKNNKSGGDATSGVYFYIIKYNKSNLKPKQGRLYLSK